MKVFEFAYSSDDIKDWVYADTKEIAITFYAAHLSTTEEDLIENHKISEVPDEELDTIFTLDIEDYQDIDDEDYDEEDRDDSGYKIKGTFRDLIRGKTSPDIIATTEF